MTQDLLNTLIYGAITTRPDGESPIEAVCKMLKMKGVNDAESYGLDVFMSTHHITSQLENKQ